MTQEEKQLLLIDLCARLPYGVKYQDRIEGGIHILSLGIIHHYERFIPLLRPMSSMTDEEKNKLDLIINKCNKKVFTCPKEERRYNFFDMEQVYFYLSHHFDINELILKNLAIEAPEGMYKV